MHAYLLFVASQSIFTFSPGKLVPIATNESAVTASFSPTEQPKCDATSPITAVRMPIHKMDIQKQIHPSAISMDITRVRP